MAAFMLPKEHIDVLVALAFDGPRHEPHSPAGAWQPPWWLARAHGTPNDVGWLLVRENLATVCHHYPYAQGDELPGPRPHWILSEPGACGYRCVRHDYQLTAVEGLAALATFERVAGAGPRYSSSRASEFCAALREALIAALPGIDAAPAAWDRGRLAAAAAATAMVEPAGVS